VLDLCHIQPQGAFQLDSEVIQTLGKYEILAEQGRGGMGVVYKARDRVLGRIVALKTLTLELVDSPDSLKRFYREAQAAGGLQHPNLVTIFDLGEASGRPYIAMEFVEGESLRDIIERRAPMPLPRRLKIIRQFCSGLAYAHEHGLVHRDVKPANILIRNDDTAKVVDFGIVHVESSDMTVLQAAALTRQGMFLGTVHYASPEQLNERPVDQRSDIFSVGVVIYEFLSYRRPFDAPTAASVLSQILTKDPEPLSHVLPGIPPQLDAIVSRCLEKEPGNRYLSLQDLILELDPIAFALQHDLAQDLVSQVPDLIARRDFSRAREVLRDALLLDSSHPRAKSLMNDVVSEMRRFELSGKVEALLSEAQGFLEKRDYEVAVRSFEEAVKLDSHHEQALHLLAAARQKQAQADQIRQSLTAAKNAYRNGDLTDAELTLKQVLELDESNSDAQTILVQIQQERTEREKRFRLGEALWEVRNLLENARYEDATVRLARLQPEFSDDSEVGKLVIETQQKTKEFQAALQDAKALLGAGRVRDAVEGAGRLASRFPQRPEATELYQFARKQSDLLDRREALAASLTSIQGLIDGKDYVQALEECETSKQRFPESVELDRLAMLAKSHKLAQELERQVQASCHRIQNILDARRYDEAAAEAEREIARFPGSPQLVQLLVSARHGQFEATRQPATPTTPLQPPFDEPTRGADKSIDTIFAESRGRGSSEAVVETPVEPASSGTYSATQVFSVEAISALPPPAPIEESPSAVSSSPVESAGIAGPDALPMPEPPVATEVSEAQPVAGSPSDWLKSKYLLLFAVVLVVFAVASLVRISRRRHAPPPPVLVALTISTSPAGVTVSVDGRDYGRSPVDLKLSPGPHQIEAKQTGYEPVSSSLNAAPGMSPVPALILKALPLKLRLDAGEIKKVSIKWDDEAPSRVTTGEWNRDVDAGPQPQNHTLEISASGATAKFTVQVTAGAAPVVTSESKTGNFDVVTLTSFNGEARAQFSSTPGKASIDGQPYDLSAAASALNNLASATHTVSWDNGAGAISKEFETGSNPSAAIFLMRTSVQPGRIKRPAAEAASGPLAPGPAEAALQQKITDQQNKAFAAEKDGRLAEPDQDNAIFYANQLLQLDPENKYAPQILQYCLDHLGIQVNESLQSKDFATADRILGDLDRLRPGDPAVAGLHKTVAEAREAAAKPHAPPPPTPVLSKSANLVADGYEFFGTIVVVGHRVKFIWSPGSGPHPPPVDLSCGGIKEAKADRSKGRFHVTTKDNKKYEFISEQATGDDVKNACAKP